MVLVLDEVLLLVGMLVLVELLVVDVVGIVVVELLVVLGAGPVVTLKVAETPPMVSVVLFSVA